MNHQTLVAAINTGNIISIFVYSCIFLSIPVYFCQGIRPLIIYKKPITEPTKKLHIIKDGIIPPPFFEPVNRPGVLGILEAAEAL